MARLFIGIALATLVGLSAVAHADAADKTAQAKTGHVSMGTIVVTKHYDKASPTLN